MGCNMGISDLFSLSGILAKIRDALSGRKTLIGILLSAVAALRAFAPTRPDLVWVNSVADTLDYVLSGIGVGVDGNLATGAGLTIWGLVDKIRKAGK